MSTDLFNSSSFGRINEKDSKTRGPKLEFPEIQVIPSKSEVNGEEVRHGFGKKPVLVGDAKKRFSKMAMKVLTKIVVEEAIESEPELCEEKKKAAGKSKEGSTTPQSGGVSPAPSKKGAGSLPDLPTAECGGKRSSIKAPPNQFASLVRLARFRRMTNAFARSSQSSSRRNSVTDIEEEEDMPSIPRFCATLSPEAQYAMMKGYEDVLLENIKSVRSEYNNMLYRVKTPHQKVDALYITETADASDAMESRGPYTISRQPSGFDGMEHSFNRTWTNHPRDQKPGFSLPFGRDQTFPKLGGEKTYEPTESQVKRIKVPKQKQLKLTFKFQRAMDILDTLKDNQGLPVTSTTRKKKVTNPIAFYNSWSQSWAKEFKFEYSKS